LKLSRHSWIISRLWLKKMRLCWQLWVLTGDSNFFTVKKTIGIMNTLTFFSTFFLALALAFVQAQDIGERPFRQTHPSVIPAVTGYVTTHFDTTNSGYYFLANMPNDVPLENRPSLMLLDQTGHLVYARRFQGHLVNLTTDLATDFKLHDNGLMSFYKVTQANGVNNFAVGKFFLMDSTFTIIDSLECQNGLNTDGHELQFLPNGNYMMLCTKDSFIDLSSYIIKDEPGDTNAKVVGQVIQELNANRQVVFEWDPFDHFHLTDMDPAWIMGNTATLDWTHSNALERSADGNILLSSRHFNEVTKIDRQTGNILWRLGGKQNEFTLVNSSGYFTGQHDIRQLSNGHYTLFNNGQFSDPQMASAVEFSLNEQQKTAKLEWAYTHNEDLYSLAMGNFARLDNGHGLVNFGAVFPRYPNFVEVDASGSPVFQLKLPALNYTYRVHHVETLPWQLHRPMLQAFFFRGNLYLDAGAGHSEYYWSNGQTTRFIRVNEPGDYYVYVPYGDGGYISSEVKMIPALPGGQSQKLAAPESMQQEAGKMTSENMPVDIRLYPNPAANEVFINMPADLLSNGVEIKLIDYSGREWLLQTVWQSAGPVVLDVASLPQGLYLVQLSNPEFNLLITEKFSKE